MMVGCCLAVGPIWTAAGPGLKSFGREGGLSPTRPVYQEWHGRMVISLISGMLKRRRFAGALIVVSGLPRSGTSMMMKMLEAGGLEIVTDGERTADEDNPKGYYELERVKELDKGGDKSWLGAYRGKVVKVISFLLRELPDDFSYKVIFMRREMEEVLASQKKMEDRRGEESQTEDEKMTELYKNHLWRVNYLLKNSKNFVFLEVPYREVLERPGDWARRVAEFIGGELDVEKMAAVADPKLYRNRKQA